MGLDQDLYTERYVSPYTDSAPLYDACRKTFPEMIGGSHCSVKIPVAYMRKDYGWREWLMDNVGPHIDGHSSTPIRPKQLDAMFEWARERYEELDAKYEHASQGDMDFDLQKAKQLFEQLEDLMAFLEDFPSTGVYYGESY